MVGRVGVEPTFSDFQSGAPTVYATDPYGVSDGVRFHNLRGHNAALCQLSYRHMAGSAGFEPADPIEGSTV